VSFVWHRVHAVLHGLRQVRPHLRRHLFGHEHRPRQLRPLRQLLPEWGQRDARMQRGHMRCALRRRMGGLRDAFGRRRL
jgi:hypothetical protein